jgi:hypothetical protein
MIAESQGYRTTAHAPQTTSTSGRVSSAPHSIDTGSPSTISNDRTTMHRNHGKRDKGCLVINQHTAVNAPLADQHRTTINANRQRQPSAA